MAAEKDEVEMKKKLFFAALIGWGVAFFIAPRDVAGWFKARTA